MKYFKYITKHWIYYLVMMGIAVGCFPESANEKLGPEPNASFVVEEVTTENNTYVLRSTSDNAFMYFWDRGNGFEAGEAVDTIFLPDKGEYEIVLRVAGSGGISTSGAQTIVVETSDPVAGNLVTGGKMEEGDEDSWTIFTITDGVSFEMKDGKMTATGGGWGHAAFYQTIEVQANKEYRFSAAVSGNGASDVWFELYFGTDTPAPYADYSSGGNRLGLNTWAGCGNAKFSGNLATIGCAGEIAGKDGFITFSESGTLYLLIKTGGADLGNGGISIDNIELRGTK